MSGKPTPMTDAEYWKNYPNGSDCWEFARKLERENALLVDLLLSAIKSLWNYSANDRARELEQELSRIKGTP